ncbi:hypothetical protein [Amycolatopsis sp. NPDC051128]|uniref:hypothetical protein n=1 Tax=Amycolatopsis sp. NPDC051128 TaxID=3155412 RepID=UPI003439724E
MRPTPSNIVVPRTAEPSPGERPGQTGPGWSWTAFFRPWRLGQPTPKPRWATFGTAGEAIDDLVRCLKDGNAGEGGARCAAELQARRPRGELVLCDGGEWAYVVSKLGPGVHLSDAAEARFSAWYAQMAPRRAEIITAGRPVLY